MGILERAELVWKLSFIVLGQVSVVVCVAVSLRSSESGIFCGLVVTQ